MLAEHFESPVVQLIPCTARLAEKLVPGAHTLVVSEGYRPHERASRDLHSELRALDFTLRVEQEGGLMRRATRGEYVLISECVRADLGDDKYDFLVHGEGLGLHIHAEYDPH